MLSVVVASVCLALPAHLGVTDSFRAPACERCAGNRGLELATSEGSVVTAALSGTASWVGPVGNRLYVVLRSASDRRVRVTYGGLASTTLQVGDSVVAGEIVGIARAELFFGMRIGDVHVDPLRYSTAGTDRVESPESVQTRPRFRITLGGRAASACGAALPSR